MRVKTFKTEKQIRKQFFDPIQKSSRISRPWTQVEPTWCEAAELRLFSKLIDFKPAGVNKHFNLMALTHYMNNIYEDEEISFEDVLAPEDLHIQRIRRELPQSDGKVMVFKPKYKLRPTSKQIEDFLNEQFDMKAINSNENVPDAFERQVEFFLPEGEFSELLEKKEKAVNAALAPPTVAPPKKKKRRATYAGSRTSTSAKKFLIAAGTIEQCVLELQQKKLELAGAVLEGAASKKMNKLTYADMKFLFDLDEKKKDPAPRPVQPPLPPNPHNYMGHVGGHPAPPNQPYPTLNRRVVPPPMPGSNNPRVAPDGRPIAPIFRPHNH